MGWRGEKTRAEILAVLNRCDRPLSAYDLLRELSDTNPRIRPTTVYRALAELEDKKRVHRIESLKSYVVCQCAPHQRASILSICNDCGSVEENVSPDLLRQLSSLLGESGFTPMRHVIEIHGVCGSCDSGRVSA